jgi:hypothetical protein
MWFFDDEVCFAATSHDNAAAENFRDDLRGIAGAVHAEVSELVRGKALGVKRAKAGFVAKERSAGHSHAAREQKLDGRIEPKNRGASVAEKFGAARLGVSAAAEREDGGFLEFGSAAQGGAQLIRFDLAKSGFAEALENLGNGQACELLDAFIQINETPCELTCEKSANSGLAGSHESSKANHLGAGREATQRGRLSHCCV